MTDTDTDRVTALCQAHWDALVGAVHMAGMGDYSFHANGPEMLRRYALRQYVPVTLASFDPIVMAHMEMVYSAVALFGAEAARDAMKAHGCLVCGVNHLHVAGCPVRRCEFTFDGWIGQSVDHQREVWELIR